MNIVHVIAIDRRMIVLLVETIMLEVLDIYMNLQIRKKTAQEKALDPQLIVNLAINEPFVGEPVLAEISLLLQPRTRLYSERNNIATLSGEGVRVNYIDGPKEAPTKNNKRVIKFLYEIAPLRAEI